ncbi:MAG: helix-turn-helix domain-containing protein [Phormidesmis sp.]
MASTVSADNAFGHMLRQWRSQRNFSQLDLSVASDVSQRHISFVESGRARPSRTMVLKLATVLDVPLRQQNKMLTAAGFAPTYSEFDLSAPEVAPIRRALEFMLRQQEPYPALVMDRYWNQIKVNRGAEQITSWLLAGQSLPPDLSGQVNLMKLMLHPEGLRPYIANWQSAATHLIHRVHRESLEGHEQSQKLFDELLSYPTVRELWQAPTEDSWHLPLLTVNFYKDGQQLSFFTTITTLGTPHDITLQELRLECLFPADEATDKHIKATQPNALP